MCDAVTAMFLKPDATCIALRRCCVARAMPRTTLAAAEQSYRTKIDTAREFLRMKDVPTTIRRRIMAFLDNLYAENTAFDEEEILSQLPEHMQTELVHHMYNKITASVFEMSILPNRAPAGTLIWFGRIAIQCDGNNHVRKTGRACHGI